MIPEIAIIGHPNEGKSSVLSTLAEDDSVRVSPTPGETKICRTFPVIIDGKEVLRFIDTPGFQNPQRILAELKTFSGSSNEKLTKLSQFTAESVDFKDDHELLTPITRGAGIIYVVDGSRPVRDVDRSEMEILRQTGKPRMAIINCKTNDDRFIEDWKDEFRVHFNSSRMFNAHRATYAERIELLEALKGIDQDWQTLLSRIIDSFKQDWELRTRLSATSICSLLSESLSLKLGRQIENEVDRAQKEQQLLEKYSKTINNLEKVSQKKIRVLFKHNIFNYSLPPHSILKEDLLNKRTWQLLGLTAKQMLVLGSISGGAVGAGVDLAALGHGLGLFTALGTIAGAVGALTGSNRLNAQASIMGITIAGPKIEVGPARNIAMLFVLLNRSLLFYRHTINWSHGRRNYEQAKTEKYEAVDNYTKSWSPKQLRTCHSFFKTVLEKNAESRIKAEERMLELVFSTLMQISREDGLT